MTSQQAQTRPHPAPSAGLDVETALRAADSANAIDGGHWPQVAAVLASEVRRLRTKDRATLDRVKMPADGAEDRGDDSIDLGAALDQN